MLVGLLTGNSQPNAILKLKAAGIDTNVFDLDISSFGDKHATRPGLVEEAMNKVEVKCHIRLNIGDVVLIGDTPLDIECARETGCRVVSVDTGHFSRNELAVCRPDFVCGTLVEAKKYLTGVICLEQDQM